MKRILVLDNYLAEQGAVKFFMKRAGYLSSGYAAALLQSIQGAGPGKLAKMITRLGKQEDLNIWLAQYW
jgi:hypothetical protein